MVFSSASWGETIAEFISGLRVVIVVEFSKTLGSSVSLWCPFPLVSLGSVGSTALTNRELRVGSGEDVAIFGATASAMAGGKDTLKPSFSASSQAFLLLSET